MKNKKGLFFALFCGAGFLLLFIIVPRIALAVAASRNFEMSGTTPLLFVAIAWFIWGELCVFIKKKIDLD
jgi:hypothetical protein